MEPQVQECRSDSDSSGKLFYLTRTGPVLKLRFGEVGQGAWVTQMVSNMSVCSLRGRESWLVPVSIQMSFMCLGCLLLGSWAPGHLGTWASLWVCSCPWAFLPAAAMYPHLFLSVHLCVFVNHCDTFHVGSSLVSVCPGSCGFTAQLCALSKPCLVTHCIIFLYVPDSPKTSHSSLVSQMCSP